MAKVSLRAYNREIETMIDRGQLDEAIAHCRHILKTYPKHLETYRLLGKANLEYKRYGDAADIFSRILVSAPNDFVAQVGMSIIRDEENRLDDAIWHMERAFETQPSNPAIQGELQRLYARRDGVRPPRIRMTRGALANMYVQGELYPQAISEIKSVLAEDANRADMQALLARACYRSGLRNEAADVASALLKRYPYSYDGNRVMVEILGAEHPESTQLYRQRLYELDPYAAHVTGSMFQSDQVSDAAVNIERLDWNGQPVSMQTDWSESQAIGLEAGSQEEQPDWLNRPADETSRMEDAQPAPSQPTPAPIFESTAPFDPSPAQPADDLPDFLREAGWGKSTGTVDESQPAFNEEDAQPSDALEQADLPDWIKAMKPAESEPAPHQEDEELPDWIANIGTGALASEASDETDWMKPAEQASEEPAAPAGELPDWMSQPAGEPQADSAAEPAGDLDWLNKLGDTQPTSPVARGDDRDWIKNLGETDEVPAAEQDDLDWMKDLGTSGTEPSAIPSDTPDWLKGIGETEPDVTAAEKDQPDWLKELSSESQSALPSAAEEETPDWLRQETEPASAAPDFLDQLTEEPILNTPAEPAASTLDTDKLGVSEQERDDSFAWLESLAAKQGATEGLLTRPEDRLEEEPEWVRQAKGLQSEPPAAQPPVEQEQPAASVEDLGRTEQDQDDSFAWLESLAAKQGATEGLLTKPEERLEEEPEWVKRAKDLSAQEQPGHMPEPELGEMAAMQEPEPEPEAAVDHAAAWMQSLMDETPADFQATAADAQMEEPAAVAEPEPAPSEQPAAVDETPDWLRGVEDETTADFQPAAADAQMEEPAAITEPEPAAVDDTASWLQSLGQEETTADFQPTAADAQMEEPAAMAAVEPSAPDDEIETWLKDLEGEGTSSEPAGAADETSMWLRGLEERETPAPEPVETSDADLPAWMTDITEEPSSTPAETSAADASAGEPSLAATWMPPAGEETTPAEPRAEEDSLPGWLSELEKEEEQIATQADGEDLPEWLRDRETAPPAAEPTLASDWKPVEAEIEPLPLPSEPFDMPLEEPAVVSESEPAAEPEPVMEAPAAAPEPIREPAARQETGELNIPLVDPVLEAARSELSGDNVNGALESYGRLIRKARYLDEVIYDLREATYRYPVDVNIWQSLGDAYMRANRLQDALDAYTKAEELLR